MKKSKSKLLVVLIIVLIIAILSIAGAYLYFATDLFKTNDQLFIKYFAKNIEMIERFSKNDESQNNLTQGKYIENTEITFNIESNNKQIANQTIPARNFKINSVAKVDTLNKKDSRETTLKYLNEDLFTLKYLRNEDLYALKSDEVITKYLAFDNNNLKELAEKYGIEDTSLIPNKILPVDLKGVFSFTKEQQKEILQKYLPVINNVITKDKYSNEKNITINVNDKDIIANAYSVELTQNDALKLFYSLVNTLKTDDDTLNIVVEKLKMLDSTSTITLNDLKQTLNDIEDSANDFIIDSEGKVKITVYAYKGELIRTEISSGDYNIKIDTEKGITAERIIISFDTPTNYGDIINMKKIEIVRQQTGTQKHLIMIATFNFYEITDGSESLVKLSTQIQENNQNKNAIIILNLNDETCFTTTINTNIEQDDTIEVEELSKENSATINKFTPQYTETLSGQIIARLQSLYTKKLERIQTIQQTANQIQDEQQAANEEINNNINNNINNTVINNTINNNISNTVINNAMNNNISNTVMNNTID